MQLTLHSDYALRVLVYLAAHPGELKNTAQVSAAYGISHHHLVRVVRTLQKAGFIRTIPGRSGGICLEGKPSEIRLGDVFRASEPTLKLVECFDPEHNQCPIVPICRLRNILQEAGSAFQSVLDQYTLADVVGPRPKDFLNHFLTSSEESASPS